MSRARKKPPGPETLAEVSGHLERMRLNFDETAIRQIALGVEKYRATYGPISPFHLRIVIAINCHPVHTLQLHEMEQMCDSVSEIGRGVVFGLTGIKISGSPSQMRKKIRKWHAAEVRMLADPE